MEILQQLLTLKTENFRLTFLWTQCRVITGFTVSTGPAHLIPVPPCCKRLCSTETDQLLLKAVYKTDLYNYIHASPVKAHYCTGKVLGKSDERSYFWNRRMGKIMWRNMMTAFCYADATTQQTNSMFSISFFTSCKINRYKTDIDSVYVLQYNAFFVAKVSTEVYQPT